MGAPNAVELTVDAAWYIADALGLGTFPWVLAITPPYADVSQRSAFNTRQAEDLMGLGVIAADTGRIDPVVADWIKAVCFPDRWLELRYVEATSASAAETPAMLRGFVARRGARTIVALRSAALVTFTAMDIDDPSGLVPVLAAGLSPRAPARFTEFSLPARVGARADEQLRSGADLAGVLDYLGVPASARRVVESVFAGQRTYVEVVAGQHHDGTYASTEVGIAVIDTSEGRVLVSPAQAFDGEWVSTFAPGTPLAIALAVDGLTATLTDGQWFPAAQLSH